MRAPTPAEVLFEGAAPPALLPVCDHYAGSEKLMRKALALQRAVCMDTTGASIGPMFDVTLDCEDGAQVGHETEHAHLVASLVGSEHDGFGRVGVRIHDFGHPHWRDDVRIILHEARRAPAYVTLPKIRHVDEAAQMCAFIDATRREAGIARPIPVHALVETHGALAHVFAHVFELAALPGIEALSFGLMDFVSAHAGAIPDDAMRAPGQFDHPLVRRAKLEIAAACHAFGKTPSHNVSTEVVARDAERARRIRLYADVEHPSGADSGDRGRIRAARARGDEGHRHPAGRPSRAVGADPPSRRAASRAARPRQLPLLLVGAATRARHGLRRARRGRAAFRSGGDFIVSACGVHRPARPTCATRSGAGFAARSGACGVRFDIRSSVCSSAYSDIPDIPFAVCAGARSGASGVRFDACFSVHSSICAPFAPFVHRPYFRARADASGAQNARQNACARVFRAQAPCQAKIACAARSRAACGRDACATPGLPEATTGNTKAARHAHGARIVSAVQVASAGSRGMAVHFNPLRIHKVFS